MKLFQSLFIVLSVGFIQARSVLPVDIEWFLQSYDIGFDGFFIEFLGFSSSFATTFPNARLHKSFFRHSMDELPMRTNSSVMWELLPAERLVIEQLLSDRHISTEASMVFTGINTNLTMDHCSTISSEQPADFSKYHFKNLSRPLAVDGISPLTCCEACIGTSHCTAWTFAEDGCLLKGFIQPTSSPTPTPIAGSLLRTTRLLSGRLPAPAVQIFHGTSCHAFNTSAFDAPRDANTIRIGRFMTERDVNVGGMDPFEMLVMKCSMYMDEIWVPTDWNKFIFQSYYRSMNIPMPAIAVIPEAVDTSLFDPRRYASTVTTKNRPFEFLSVFKWEHRKGWDVLLEAYWAAFSITDNVQLRLRTYRPSFLHGSRNITSYIEQFARDRFRKELSDLAPVIWDGYDASLGTYPSFMSREEVINMLLSADAFVLPTRGEGWGLPVAEAMALEIPVIVTNCSGPASYATDTNAYLIQLDDGLDELGFAKPNVASLMTLMRAVMNNPTTAKQKAKQGRVTMSEISPEVVTDMMRERLEELLRRRGWEVRHEHIVSSLVEVEASE